jgi:hypothetical protein
MSRRERGRYPELAGSLPERGVVLVELHCVGKHELDVLRELSNIRVLFPLKVFLGKGSSSKSPTGVVVTHIDLLKAHRAGYRFVVDGPDLFVG